MREENITRLSTQWKSIEKDNCYYLIRRYTHGDTVGLLKSPKASTTYTGEDCNISLFFKHDVTNKGFKEVWNTETLWAMFSRHHTHQAASCC
jgi:hypothetical protein